MKKAIKAALAILGLAPVTQVDRLTAEVGRAETKIAQLEDRLVQCRADADTWKRRYDDATDALAGWKQAATRAQADAERVKAGAERFKADLEHAKADVEHERARAEEWKGRAEGLTSEVQGLKGRLESARARLEGVRAQLEEAQRATTSSNEHLMAMEVKLDLIEAAIQVLDARTREAAVSRG